MRRAVLVAVVVVVVSVGVFIVQSGGLGSKHRGRGDLRPIPTAALADAAPAARPLHVPQIRPGERCPVAARRSQPTARLGVMLGDGPVRAVGVADGVLPYTPPSDNPLNAFRGSRWGGGKVLWAVDPTVKDDVVIRGHQIDGDGELRFGMSVDPDTTLVLHGPGAQPYDGTGWRNFPSTTRVQHPGCYAYQIDTTSTSTMLVLAVR
jgi:hypothetical protein